MKTREQIEKRIEMHRAMLKISVDMIEKLEDALDMDGITYFQKISFEKTLQVECANRDKLEIAIQALEWALA